MAVILGDLRRAHTTAMRIVQGCDDGETFVPIVLRLKREIRERVGQYRNASAFRR
jgi:hypothetical protein